MTTAIRSLESVARWNTVQEILRQPDIWRNYAPQIDRIATSIRQWIARRGHDEIWFCGAGTSSFIGETLAAYLNCAPGPARHRAIATTELVATPRSYLRDDVRLLVVLFGRSGDSPETIGTLDLLAQHAPGADRLNITCNAQGALAKAAAAGPGEQQTIILPPETDDQGFAMTSSYTTMLLAALACFDPTPPAPVSTMFTALADAGDAIIHDIFPKLHAMVTPQRAVFLGAGPLTGAARESALKVLELGAGAIGTLWDTPLGFRHGPKSVVDDATAVFVFLSDDVHTRAYDHDLAAELEAQFGADTVFSIGSTGNGAMLSLPVPAAGNDAWSSVLYVLVAQMLAVIWSDRLGLNVDNPFSTGFLTRVVTGVRLYPLPKIDPGSVGGIDLGGSKIEVCLFNGALAPTTRRRTAINAADYDTLMDTLVADAHWLEQKAGGAVPIGIGIPGLIEPATGVSTMANLPATGHSLSRDLAVRLNRPIAVANDCKCFALSEANGGAGEGYRTVFGLILGTGVGGGVCVNAKLAVGLNRVAGEVGHFGLPADTATTYGLPLVLCGCGRTGCYETLLSGPGMSRIYRHLTGREASPAEIAHADTSCDSDMARAFDIWMALLAELARTIQLTVDPDCIVLGGGLSRIQHLDRKLASVFPRHSMAGVRAPHFTIAKFGDSSGVRGAAILARAAMLGRDV